MGSTAPQDVIVDLTTIKGIVTSLAEIRLQKAKLDDQEKLLTDIIKNALGSEGTVGLVDGETVATFRETSRRTFDSKVFRADVGDHVADKYTKTSTVRTFRLTVGGAK